MTDTRVHFSWRWLLSRMRDCLAARRHTKPWAISRLYRQGYADALRDLWAIDADEAQSMIDRQE